MSVATAAGRPVSPRSRPRCWREPPNAPTSDPARLKAVIEHRYPPTCPWVVASNAGAAVDPAWWRNLQVRPEATIEVGRRSVPVRARLATDSERLLVWPELVRRHATFEEYVGATSRPIPVVLLEPA